MNYKKIILCTVTTAVSANMLSTSAFALTSPLDIDNNGTINCTDLLQMKKNILQKDGDYNIFNVINLKNNLLKNSETDIEECEPFTADYSATDENVKLIGRNLIADGTTWLVQSGSAIEFKVTGTNAEITLAGDGCIEAEERYKPRYAVYVDDELIEDALMSTESKKIELFSSSSSRTATVKVIHLSEANNGAIGVSSISVTSTVKKPVKPVPKKDLSIEFIGDSITCAYGVEASSQNESFSTSTENITKSYAYLAAEKLNADYSIVGYSGHGIVSGYTANEKNTDSLVPDYYDKVGKILDYGKAEWDFENHHNDVVFINLGTNDYSYLQHDFETRSPEFVEKYVDFLKMIREKNPDAQIICTVGTMGGEEVYDYIVQAIDEFCSETGDNKITSYLSATQKMANGYGADWHPSEITQQLSAYVAADKICEALGIESDKIGLDAAENGTYDVFVNEAVGANAAYFVGYDKTFWINMVMGGDKPSDVQAYIGDIEIKAGEYRLEFDCTAGIDTEIPVEISDGSDTIFSDKVTASSESTHYSETFTVKEASDNARIIFNVGGNDYYNATFSNITLIKIS